MSFKEQIALVLWCCCENSHASKKHSTLKCDDPCLSVREKGIDFSGRRRLSYQEMVSRRLSVQIDVNMYTAGLVVVECNNLYGDKSEPWQRRQTDNSIAVGLASKEFDCCQIRLLSKRRIIEVEEVAAIYKDFCPGCISYVCWALWD